MVLSTIRFPEENPFYRIKARQIFLCFFLLTFGIAIQLIIISSIFNFDYKDPIFASFLAILILILAGAWLLRQCKLVGINLKQLIGKVPSNYQWLPLVGLVIARVLFSKGVFRLSYYPLSFIAPSFIEYILNDNINNNIFILASKTFSPALYYLLNSLYIFVVIPLFNTFVFQGIFLHRWAAKWGSRTAILALCILYGILIYQNVLGGISFILIYTLLYIKTRTLIVLIVARILETIIYVFWELFDFLFTISSSTRTVSVLEQIRSEWRVGVFFFVLSAPWIVHFIYKNWPRPNEPLPYFANTSR
jgi:membrane protease YdiL (CAAX protease family)